MITPSSEPANEPTATAGLDTSPVSHTKKKTKKHNRSHQYDELRINNAMADMQSGTVGNFLFSFHKMWCAPYGW